jgi:non-ribosomal peptide synthetase component F
MTEMLHHWVTSEANRRPDATAVALGEERLSYGELETLSNQLARALRERGCARGDRVALLVPKSPLAVVCLLGIYKADCVYVPLDVESPAKSLARILSLADCRCLLASASLAPRVRELLSQPDLPTLRIGWLGIPDQSAGMLPVAFRFSDIGALPGTPLQGAFRAQDTAHILFDPRSGAAPRGVTTTHHNLVDFVEWARSHFRLNESDRLSGYAPLTADHSLFDIFGSLASGAELHMVPAEARLLPVRLAAWIRTSGITLWSAPSVVLDNMAKLDAVQPWDFPDLRRVLWSGGLPTASLGHWMKQLPHVEFTKLYGAPETTVASAFHTVASFPDDGAEQMPLGTARDGTELLLLDHNLQPVATGGHGDLYVSGDSLSPGYWRDAEASRRAFPQMASGERVYRTGSHGLRGADGHIYLADASRRQPVMDSLQNIVTTTTDSDDMDEAGRWRAWDEQQRGAAARVQGQAWTHDGTDNA